MKMFITALVALVFASTGSASETPDAPTNSSKEIETAIALETAVVREDPQMSHDIEIPDYDIDTSNLWEDSTSDPLVRRFAVGILRSRVLQGTKDKIYWERCGEEVAEEDLVPGALMWAAVLEDSLEQVAEETGVEINPWGAFATMMNEGGANECALNFAARLWASQHTGRELITETWRGKTVTRKVEKKVVEKFRQSYDRDTVWRILNHPDFPTASVERTDKKTGEVRTIHIKNKFDGGPWQLRKSMKRMTREQFDDLTSVVPGVYMGTREMARRAKAWMFRYRMKYFHPRPWKLWPGTRASMERVERYDKKITSVARWLGASREEIQVGYVAVDRSGKKRKRATGPLKYKPVRASVDKPQPE